MRAYANKLRRTMLRELIAAMVQIMPIRYGGQPMMRTCAVCAHERRGLGLLEREPIEHRCCELARKVVLALALCLALAGCTGAQLVPVPAEADVEWQRQITARLNALVECQDIRIQQCIDEKEVAHAKPH